jgi:anti-sigma B factor antagonist
MIGRTAMSSDEVHAHTRTGVEGARIVEILGQVDLATAPAFQHALDTAAADRSQLTVDLTGLDFLDSAGIKVLFGLATRLDLHLVVDCSSVIAGMLDVSGLAQATTIRAVEASGRQRFAGSGQGAGKDSCTTVPAGDETIRRSSQKVLASHRPHRPPAGAGGR